MLNSHHLLTLLLLFISCKEIKTEELLHNQNLIYFSSTRIAELGDEKWLAVQSKIDDKIKIEYIDDIIFASRFIDVNACGNYAGDIQFQKDSIYLMYKLLPGDLCTSRAIDKVTYIIKNPEMKEYKLAVK
ncbi:hypothetical protein [Flavobacterium sp. ACN6]|uniref:hypothetical protein n=1 Tax=Flavobacterium sp. ACN6 TaxID=1920426 RepID=UPI000BB3BAD0|nr:hypothetical protein [Flavobacterium sp. ACN6]PBJ14274.1 hypothetical protein BSF42_06900 [Flavobacterium sp. ACN6]